MATRIGDKPLSDLTDEELQQELAKRRRSRGASSPVPSTEPQSETLRNRQIRQYYANLELKPGASLDEVQARYRDLSRRYNPDRHLNDPEKHAAATRLLQELTRAYDALVVHLDKKK
jgi:DnaJ-domain-containing protein 1